MNIYIYIKLYFGILGVNDSCCYERLCFLKNPKAYTYKSACTTVKLKFGKIHFIVSEDRKCTICWTGYIWTKTVVLDRCRGTPQVLYSAFNPPYYHEDCAISAGVI